MTIQNPRIYLGMKPRMLAVSGRSPHILIRVVVSVFLLFLASSAMSADSELAGRFIESANKAIAAGKLKEAEDFLDRASAVAPQDERVRQMRERLSAQKRAGEQARAEKRRAKERAEEEVRRKAANKDTGIAAYNAGRFNEAYTLLKPLAEEGDAWSQHYLGMMYRNRRGVSTFSRNDSEAAKWLTKAAEQGVSDSQYFLGHLYCNGEGVASDDAECAKWIRKAAEQGNTHAQYEIAEMYGKGKGVARDDAQVTYWVRKSAEGGNVEAQYWLGLIYKTSWDLAEAHKWFRIAASQGHRRAQEQLRKMERRGY